MKNRIRKIVAVLLTMTLMSSDIAAIAEEIIHTLTLPKALQIIEEEAFYGDTSIEKVVVPDGTTEIRSRAFADSSLTEIELPDTLTFIADDAFEGCGDFTLSVPENCYAYDWAVEMGYIDDQPPTPDENFTIEELDDGTLSIVDYIGEETYVVIPDNINGAKVTVIGESAFQSKGIVSVAIPEGIVEIGDYAFSWNWELECRTLPSTLRRLGEYAFNQCNLSKIELPEGLLTIGQGAFGGNTRVSAVHIPASVTNIGGSVFYDCDNMESITLDAGNTAYEIVDGVMLSRDGSTLLFWLPEKTDTEYIVPDSVREISGHAFVWAEDLARITLPESLETIGDSAFWGCSKLENFVIPGNCKTIGGNAFEFCEALTEIVLPEGLEMIDWATFSDCTNLERVVLPESVTWIDGVAFMGCTALKSVNLPASIESMGENVFDGCENLTATVVEGSYAHRWCIENSIAFIMNGSVTSAPTVQPTATPTGIPTSEPTVAPTATPGEEESLRDFYYEIVDDAYAVILGYVGPDTNLIIPSHAEGYEVREIGMNAFRNAGIENVVLPETLTVLQQYAFYGCEELTGIELPESLRSIGYGAFYECINLESVQIHEGVETIGAYAFYNTGITGIDLPDSLTEIGQDVFEECSKLTEITIPELITTIPGLLFRNCTALTKVVLPENLTTINYWAFKNCSSLEELIIPEGINNMNTGAFEGCEKLILKVVEGSFAHNICVTKGLQYELIRKETPEYLAWTAEGGWATITGYTGEPINLVIPEYIGVFRVLTIDDEAFLGCSSLENVSIPDGVTYIGQGAFRDCTNLKSITIPDSVNYIAGQAFSGCSSLSEVTLPEGITLIENALFKDCSNMNTVVIPESIVEIGTIAFSGCSSLQSITIPENVTWIGDGAFLDCNSLKGIEIPDCVESIGYGAFDGCSNLTEIVIPDSVTSMGDRVFMGCSRLTSVTLSESITSIGTGSFSDCAKLVNIHIPDGVERIGDWAFAECENLTSITIPDRVVSIGERAFSGCSSLKEISISTGISQVSDETFFGCTSLENIVIPDSITSIGTRAFCSCRSLTRVKIPDSVTNIGDYAFANCSGLIDVILPRSVDAYGTGVFSGCSSLVELEIPRGATAICAEEFRDCSSLTSITISDGVTSIGDRAFSNCTGLKTVILPDHMDFIGSYAFMGCSSLTNITMPDRMEYIGEGAFFDCSKLSSISIPDGIEEIDNMTFCFCESLSDVTIPDSVTCIGEEAFKGCRRLTGIVLPDDLQEIRDRAFYNAGLTSISFPDCVSYIGAEAFGSCLLSTVRIPDSVTEIHDAAFRFCANLVSVTIPASVIRIADDAFAGCLDLIAIYGEPGSCAEAYANERRYDFVDVTAIVLDMSNATLNRTTLVPGDTVIVSGIRIKNADYVHISGNNLHLKEEDIGEAAFDVQVDNTEDYQTLDAITMVLSKETAVEGRFYISVQAFDNDGRFTEIDQTTLAYTVSFEMSDLPALDMSGAKLNKSSFAPGETIVISSIRVRNADRVHFSGNNIALTVKDVDVANSSGYRTMEDVELTLSESAPLGGFYISVQAFDTEGNASEIDQSRLKYNVVSEPIVTPVPEEGELVSPATSQAEITAYTNESVVISWSASEGADRYGIWFYDTEPGTYVEVTSALSVTHTFTQKGDFCVEIYALAGSGEDQKQSGATSVQIHVLCKHMPKESTYVAHVFEEKPGDSEKHFITGIIYDCTCGECGKKYQVTNDHDDDGNPFPQLDLHSVNNEGYCTQCGYQCAHNFANTGEVKPYTGIWASCGNETHERISVSYYFECTKCGMRILRRIQEENFIPEPHIIKTEQRIVSVHQLSDTETVVRKEAFHEATVETWEYCNARAYGCTYQKLTASEQRAVVHTYVDGKCECGKVQPSFTTFESMLNSIHGEDAINWDLIYLAQHVRDDDRQFAATLGCMTNRAVDEIMTYAWDITTFNTAGLVSHIWDDVTFGYRDEAAMSIVRSLAGKSYTQQDVEDTFIAIGAALHAGADATSITFSSVKKGLLALDPNEVCSETRNVFDMVDRIAGVGKLLGVIFEDAHIDYETTKNEEATIILLLSDYTVNKEYLENQAAAAKAVGNTEMYHIYNAALDKLDEVYKTSAKNYLKNPVGFIDFETWINGVEAGLQIAGIDPIEEGFKALAKNSGTLSAIGDLSKAANVLLIVHTGVTLICGELLHGNDLYTATEALYENMSIVCAMTNRLNTAIDAYIWNPNAETEFALATEAAALADYKQLTLDNVELYRSSKLDEYRLNKTTIQKERKNLEIISKALVNIKAGKDYSVGGINILSTMVVHGDTCSVCKLK